jgi:hypothetical protein
LGEGGGWGLGIGGRVWGWERGDAIEGQVIGFVGVRGEGWGGGQPKGQVFGFLGLLFWGAEEELGHEGVGSGALGVLDDIGEGLGMAAGTEEVQGGGVQGEFRQGVRVIGQVALAATEGEKEVQAAMAGEGGVWDRAIRTEGGQGNGPGWQISALPLETDAGDAGIGGCAEEGGANGVGAFAKSDG